MWKKGIVLLTVGALFISTALSAAAVEKQEEKKQSVKLELPVKSAILMEQKTGKILFEKNSSEKLPMASTTKIMTTLLCLESGGLDDQFVVDGEAIKVEGVD